MQDLVITAVSEYGYDKLKYWVNSLNRSGFTGRKVVIAFNIKDDTIKQLQDNGIEVVLTSTNRNYNDTGYQFELGLTYQVPMLRHYFYWQYLKQQSGIRYVISTDCADVVFQSNPSDWLDVYGLDGSLFYASEGLEYKNEDWGRQNLIDCFGPDVYETMKDNQIYNAGSMAGDFESFKEFSLNVALLCRGINNPTPDQAAVNVLLGLKPYFYMTHFISHDINWACECGTTVDPTKIDKFRPHLKCGEPTFDGEFVYTPSGDKYVMVHQYNRVPAWKDLIERKYG